jgi:hypothetical protein
MSDIISIELVGLKQLKARLGAMSPAVQNRLRVFMARFTNEVRDQVKANIAERFKSTGPLYQGVRSEQIEERDSITGRVYVEGVPYAAIQEYGGVTPPHVIEAVNGKALAFMSPASLGLSSGGGSNALVMVKKVNHPGSRIPERTYARLALVQMRGGFEDGIREVVSDGLDDAFSLAAE